MVNMSSCQVCINPFLELCMVSLQDQVNLGVVRLGSFLEFYVEVDSQSLRWEYSCLNTSRKWVVQLGASWEIVWTTEQGFLEHRWNSTFWATQSIDGLYFWSQLSPSMRT